MNILQNQDILIIIDTQYGFVTHEQKVLLNNIAKLTKSFRDKHRHICLVEYHGCGLTHSKITSLLSNYNNQSLIVKNRDSAAPYILKNFGNSPVFPLTFHLIGVNWTQCLFKTASGLLSAGHNVQSYKYASNPSFRRCDKIWQELVTKYQNKLIVKDKHE